MVYYYGWSNYQNVHFTGNFDVGHQRFYSKKYKNPVNVFYPIDKDYQKKIMKNKLQSKNKNHNLKKWQNWNSKLKIKTKMEIKNEN